MPSPSTPAQDHASLVADLRTVRERGLLRLRGLTLDALRRYAALYGLGDDEQAAAPVEALIRAAVERLDDDRLVDAARYTFGLAPGTRGWPAQDRRRRAAQAYAVTTERFRKSQEILILAQVAEQILAGSRLPSTSTQASTPVNPPPDAEPQPPTSLLNTARRVGADAILGLPANTAHFIGRSQETDAVLAALDPQEAPDGTTIICVVHGVAGVGKTALAVRVARQMARRFPDGCLYLDLHGYTREAPPVTPADALDRILRRLGVPGDEIPRHVDDRAALYRDRLAGRRILLLLDNARDAAHVRPLLPATPTCALLITSRHRLTALDEAHLIALDLLPRAESAALFRAIVGAHRLASEPLPDQIIERIVSSCGRLPLAVRIAAARWRASTTQTLRELADLLGDEQARLAELDDGDRSVAASFAVSYGDLPETDGRIFALLSIHPGDNIDTHATAALTAESAHEARRSLDRLEERHLLERPTDGRYRFHDLIRTYASQFALTDVTPPEQTAALHRLVDYYLHTAEQADITITPHRYRIPLNIGHRPSAVPQLDDYNAALTWLTTEESNLVAVCQAATSGLDRQCWQLAFTLRGFFFLTKRWDPWLTTHDLALASAHRLGNHWAEATTHNNIGLAMIEQGQLDLAATHYQQALHLFRQAGDAHGEHTAMANHAWIFYYQKRYLDFLRDSRRALEFYQRIGNHRNAAITLRGIGLAEIELGQYLDAVKHLRHALDTFHATNLRLDATMALNCLGEAYQRSGDQNQAAEYYQRAVESARLCGSIFEQSRAHLRLGELAADTGDLDRARAHWSLALDGYRTVGAPQAGELEIRLAGLDQRTPATDQP